MRGGDSGDDDADDSYWPPARPKLYHAIVRIISLHNLPKHNEQRPRFAGSRGASHGFHPELSGTFAPPNNAELSCPAIALSLHPIGGFCAVSKRLPLPQTVDTELLTLDTAASGMNTEYGDSFHCLASEPSATFLRISIIDRSHEVAYESVVLGRLQIGYRVFQMRSCQSGTRIELCYIFAQITIDQRANKYWILAHQVRPLCTILRGVLPFYPLPCSAARR